MSQRPWVRMGVYLPHLFKSGVSINLRGRESGMPKQCLNSADVGSMVEHSRGKSVAKYMRRMFA